VKIGAPREEGARETVRAVVEADPWASLEDLRVAGERKAKAEAQASHLDHMRHVVLSRIANELANVHGGSKLSEAKLDRLARGDARYEAHLKGLAAAQEEAEQASAEFWRIKADLEWQEHTLIFSMSLAKLQR
jgi:hypothetical protein